MSTEVVYQKKKYWSKVLKETAIWANYQRAIDTESIFGEWAWSESMFFIWMDISGLFIFGMEPYELEPLDPEYRTELPTLEEFLQGIKLKLIPLDVHNAYLQFYWDYFQLRVPPLLDYVTFVLATCYPEYADLLLGQRKRKLIVGESVYGTSYVDPPVIRDFMRATLYELAKRRMDFERIRKLFRIAVDKKMIAEHIAESIYNRLVMHFQTLFDSFILDYNLLNYSKLCSRELRAGEAYYGTSHLASSSRGAVTTITTWRGETFTMEIKKFDEVNMGLILNVTPLNLGILMDRRQVYKPTPKSYLDIGTSMTSYFIDWKVRRMISRYRATGIGFGNYQRPEEAFYFHKSERADHYHQLRDFYRHFDNIIENMLANKGIDIYKKNMYKRAIAMLIGHKKKRHKWGYSAYKSMTEEEFKEWWISYWQKQGLDINILNELYNSVIKWVKPLRSKLEDLGRKLAERRKRLARVLA